MQLKVLGSGSSGNCYILTSSTGKMLIIEAGISFTEIKKGINFDLTNVEGVLISHHHLDHCKAVADILKAGIDIYCSHGEWNAMKREKMNERRVRIVKPFCKYKIGEFTVIAFDVKHDSPNPLGFIIEHPESGRIMFVTDSYYVGYTFPGVNQMMIEANYCPEIVRRRTENGNFIKSVRDRVLESHMSIDTAIQLIKANDISKVNNVVILHLSDSNSHAGQFKDKVEKATAKTVTIADRGVEINFNLTPF